MNRSKLSLIVAGVAALALVVGGWFVGVQPQLAAAAAATQQRTEIDGRNDVVRAEITRLAKQYDDIGTLKSQLATLSASIPESTDTTPFIEELDQAAAASGVSISSLAFGDAQAYVPPAAPDTATGEATGAATPSPTATAEPSAAPSAPAVATDPLITSSNFTVIPVSVSVDGSDSGALDFTSAVQDGARLFLVNSIGTGSTQGEATEAGAGSEKPAVAASGSRTWTLSGFIFVLGSESTATAPGTPSVTAAAPAANG